MNGFVTWSVLGPLHARLFISICLYVRKKINNDPLMTLYVEHANIISQNNPIPNPNLNPNHEKAIP